VAQNRTFSIHYIDTTVQDEMVFTKYLEGSRDKDLNSAGPLIHLSGCHCPSVCPFVCLKRSSL